MSWLHAGAAAALLASGAMSPALATCVSKKCSDAAVVEQARSSGWGTRASCKLAAPERGSRGGTCPVLR